MSRPVAVLGAGVMGASTALHLARRGREVVLFDQAPVPFSGASRWNEGKIHLGFLYAGDPSLRTARAVLHGGLDFRDQVANLTGFAVETVATHSDDLYLVHRDSVVGADDVAAYMAAVSELVRSSPDAHRYVVDVSACHAQRLDPAELETVAAPGLVVDGWRVPERSVDTVAVGDAFVAALQQSPQIDLRLGHRVDGVERSGAQWVVRTGGDERHGPFDAVVNALWEGRPAVDASVGIQADVDPQNRYRVSLFVRTREPVDTPSAVLSVGPFGDVKNFDGRAFYLSWYPAGLLALSEGFGAPVRPELSVARRAQLADEVFDALGARLPWVRDVQAAAEEVRVEGGWVYSQGRGRLDDPTASVHQRDRLGVTSSGTFHSVDTGKYSVAPTLAEHVADLVVHTT